jgi:hypothetical protein
MALVTSPTEQAAPMTVAGNGPVRFYILYELAGQGGIDPSGYVRKSPFAVVQKDWTQALPEMVRRYPGRGEGLEVDCHGDPGILYLQPQVNPTSLPTFASAVRGLLQPYGTVEFLACHVANYDVPWLVDHWKSRPERKADAEFLNSWLKNDNDGGGSVDPYHSAVAKRLWTKGFEAAKSHNFQCPYGQGTIEANYWQAGADAAKDSPSGGRGVVLHMSRGKDRRADMDHARLARLAIETGLTEFGDSHNGPLFCTRAARLLSCTVRAAMSLQPGEMTSGMSMEEFLMTHNYRVMPTGNWRGHVFDFAPGDGVSYVGFNVARPTFVPITPGGEGPLRGA